MRTRPWSAIAVSTALSASIWGLSPWLTGHREPWDADGLFYVVALMIAGSLAGMLAPRPLWAHYVGAFIGQLGYELLLMPIGPLFPLGAAYLLGYATVFAAAAALGGGGFGFGTSIDRRMSE